MPQMQVAGEGFSTPIKPKPGLLGARPSSTIHFFNTRPFEAGCLHLGTTTLCLISQHGVEWGRLGWNGVETGGRGWGGRKIATIAITAKIAGIEKQGLTADLR